MELSLLLSSLTYSSAPAAKAMKAKAVSFMKFKLVLALLGMSPIINGPVIIPVNIRPVMRGSLIF